MNLTLRKHTTHAMSPHQKTMDLLHKLTQQVSVVFLFFNP